MTRARASLGACLVCASLAAASVAAGQRLSLASEALVRAEPGAGLLVLRARGATGAVDAEAVVWGRVANLEPTTADALVAVVRARDPVGRGELRAGRFVLATGGLRPLHLDGAHVRARLPASLSVEVFGGAPVDPVQQGRAWDWALGGRLARALGEHGSAGVAYLHRRDHGRLVDEEVALDAGGALGVFDLSARASLDLVTFGPSEVLASALVAVGDVRVEVFGIERSAERILPATSLFTVLGDVPSLRSGTSIRWRAAPRLDLAATVAARVAAREAAESLTARATLRLDADGRGALALEGRREGGPDGGWSGVRGSARIAWSAAWSSSAEIELVAPDTPAGRGALWPWALVSTTFHPAPAWELGAGVRAGASPENRTELDALLRVTRAMEVAP